MGDRIGCLNKGCDLIRKEVGEIVLESSVYRTASWGNTDQPEFLNQALCVVSALSPDDLLLTIQLIEKALGRERIIKWGSRTLDIDILFYDDAVIDKPNLVIPHPLVGLRRFALVPLDEIAPDLVHPVSGMKIKTLLSQLSDTLYVERQNSNTKIKEMNKATFDVDLSYLNDIAGGNAEFIIDMIDIFLDQTPVYFQELSAAVAEKNWKATGDIAHKIKPTLAFMGVEEAKEQMAEIEKRARQLDGVEEIEALLESLKESCSTLYSSLKKTREELREKL